MSLSSRQQLHDAWRETVRPFPAPADAKEAIWEDVRLRYGANGRHYHTLSHIHNMLTALDELRSHAQNLRALQLAIWFHDIIYEVYANDNEHQSALYAADALRRLRSAEALITAVETLILATDAARDLPDAIDGDEALIMDIDLLILAADPDEYRRYAHAIRWEYGFVPDREYRHGRIHILTRFLQRSRIYHTDLLHQKHEDRARQNIQDEIDMLSR